MKKTKFSISSTLKAISIWKELFGKTGKFFYKKMWKREVERLEDYNKFNNKND